MSVICRCPLFPESELTDSTVFQRDFIKCSEYLGFHGVKWPKSTKESMAAALQSVRDGKGLRKTLQLHNVPVETLRRRVTGQVEPGCRPGPATILTDR